MRIKNWSDFQHYKDRKPPWIKLHRDLLDNYDFHCLQDASKALLPMLWLLASESSDGRITDSLIEIGFRLRRTPKQIGDALIQLIDKGFVIPEQGASISLATSKQGAMPETEVETEVENITSKPTLDEVRGYCLERNNGIDPEKWFAYYESNGWHVGRHKMKNWRQAVITWEKNNYGGDFRDDYQKPSRGPRQRPNTQAQRAINNLRAIADAFPEVVGHSSPDSAGQTARHGGRNSPLLEGEVEELRGRTDLHGID